MKNAVRFLVIVPPYLLGWVVHVYLALTNPQIYGGFERTALLPLLGDVWHALVMPNIVFFALALAAFELLVGLLLIGKGQQVKYGLILSILFNLFLVGLGLAVRAPDGASDFLMNRLPNLVFTAIQIPLLFCEFERSLPEVLTGRFKEDRSHDTIARTSL